jgi:hypothetical protein
MKHAIKICPRWRNILTKTDDDWFKHSSNIIKVM